MNENESSIMFVFADGHLQEKIFCDVDVGTADTCIGVVTEDTLLMDTCKILSSLFIFIGTVWIWVEICADSSKLQ